MLTASGPSRLLLTWRGRHGREISSPFRAMVVEPPPSRLIASTRPSERATFRGTCAGRCRPPLTCQGPPGAPLPVPSGVDAVPGFAGRCQQRPGDVGSRLRRVRADPDPRSQRARRHVRVPRLQHLLDTGREALRANHLPSGTWTSRLTSLARIGAASRAFRYGARAATYVAVTYGSVGSHRDRRKPAWC